MVQFHGPRPLTLETQLPIGFMYTRDTRLATYLGPIERYRQLNIYLSFNKAVAAFSSPSKVPHSKYHLDRLAAPSIALEHLSAPWSTFEHLWAPLSTFKRLGAPWSTCWPPCSMSSLSTCPLYWSLAPRLGPTGRSQLLHFLSVQLQRPARPDGGRATNHRPAKMCQPITDWVWLCRPIDSRQKL